MSRIEEYIHNCFGESLDKEISFLKLDVKYPFLITDDPKKHKMWKEWYPEANEYIMQNKRISLRSRLLQLAAANGLFWINSMYYKIVHGLIYGLIYR